MKLKNFIETIDGVNHTYNLYTDGWRVLTPRGVLVDELAETKLFEVRNFCHETARKRRPADWRAEEKHG